MAAATTYADDLILGGCDSTHHHEVGTGGSMEGETTQCNYCMHTLAKLQRDLPYKPFLIGKIKYVQSIVNAHTTRDQDNILTCPLLKTYRCFKCGDFGHTPSRCTPCEYCSQRGHNERECPKKLQDDKSTFATIVFRIPKSAGWEQTLQRFRDFATKESLDIVKEINVTD